ncbi:Serine carboxypeptidase, putative [Ricinus communis]|uniref:Carboxypeptidase n=1 Tax=Ricinus communis TaxID=3988 RepID=B9S6M1_RICCO|nr:Serine carboxypeptidase, putative [Ricinus communis]
MEQKLTNFLFIALSHGSDHLRLGKSSFPSLQAEKLIRELNLLPEKDVNVIDRRDDVVYDSVDGGGRIVEKRIKFLNVEGDYGAVSVEDLGHHAGYYKIANSHFARMFYLFFESRNKKKEDPMVIWLTGGPGNSSELAMFYENGLFAIADNMSLVWNPYGWDKASNLLYAFFLEHPELVKNDFYITGESYAGHYIPAFAARVHSGNKAKEGIHINLKGFAIGNGLTDPAIQYKAYTDYALDMGLITKTDYARIGKVIPVCEMAIKLCGTDGTLSCMASYFVCNTIFSSIMASAGDINHYDIRKKCKGSLCYDFSNMEKFLNQKSVRDALGVGDIDSVSCSPTVYQAMLMDWMRNLEAGIPALLEDGIQLLVYAGEYDLICNWLGNSRWKAFGASPEVPFTIDNSEARVLRSYGPLAFLKVHDAGHMVPMDQPKAALEMLKRWTQGKLSAAPTQSRKLVAEM